MQRVKRRTFSGVVCEQEVYNVPDRIKSLEKAEPRPRFKNEEERELHRIGISRITALPHYIAPLRSTMRAKYIHSTRPVVFATSTSGA